MPSNLEHHVRQAKNGNKQALETVVGQIQERIYGLSLRLLGNGEDACHHLRNVGHPHDRRCDWAAVGVKAAP